MSFDFYYVALLFFIYSFLGWCVEVAFVAIVARKVENRGFLNGPVCPIYGCGMLGVLAALTPYRDNFILLFIGGFIICTAVELFWRLGFGQNFPYEMVGLHKEQV